MKLLFITQKIREDDDDLASVILWIKQFVREGFDIRVICLEKGKFSGDFPVYSLGKEKGYGKIRQLALFLKYIIESNRIFFLFSAALIDPFFCPEILFSISLIFCSSDNSMSLHQRLIVSFDT